ncbi:MAG: hypothetical protein ABFD60_07410 [Bryobacteraceae bacterium]
MLPRMRLLILAVVFLFAALPMFGQQPFSVQPGLIHCSEGDVLLANDEVNVKFGDFPVMFAGEELKTGHGRAEVLFSPGVFVRTGYDSSFRLLSTGPTGSHLEFLTGSLIVEALAIPEKQPITVSFGDISVYLAKAGLYRFDADPAALRVFAGSAVVETGGRKLEIEKVRILPFDGRFTPAKYKDKSTDALDNWSRRRTTLLQRANFAFWRAARENGNILKSTGWVSSPRFHVLTYVPKKSGCCSGYGYCFHNGYGQFPTGCGCKSYLATPDNPNAPGYLQSNQGLWPERPWAETTPVNRPGP